MAGFDLPPLQLKKTHSYSGPFFCVSQKYHKHVIYFCATPKRSKMPFSTSRKAQRGSLCLHFMQRGAEAELECLIIPHLTRCHCHFSTAKMNCLHLFSKVKLMSDTLQPFQNISFIITNDNKSVSVKPQECG